jgi:hypothetical protein
MRRIAAPSRPTGLFDDGFEAVDGSILVSPRQCSHCHQPLEMIQTILARATSGGSAAVWATPK